MSDEYPAMPAQDACLKSDRDAHDELVEEVHKAAIANMEAQVNLQRATREARFAEEELNLAINRLKEYKGNLQ